MPRPQILHPLHRVGAEKRRRCREATEAVGAWNMRQVGFLYNKAKQPRQGPQG